MTTLPVREDLDSSEPTWTTVCTVSQIPRDRGVAVLLDGKSVAVFRVHSVHHNTDRWFAVDHIDPLAGAPVMARGLVGSALDGNAEVIVVASPLHKERYDLATGRCLDNADASLATYPVRIVGDAVEIGCQVLSSDK